LRLKLARKTNSLTHYAKGTPSRRHRAEARRTAPTEGRHPVSGSVSLPALGCFSPFPHGTGALSVTEEYLGLEGGPPIFRQDFSCPALLEDQGTPLPVPGCHRLWRAVPDASGSSSLATGLVRVRSPLLAESHPPAQRAERLWLLSFPPATEMFQFAGFASHGYRFTVRYPLRGGLPHSDIRGSPGARPSPRLFAACHVLHRLSVPRHPPDALLVLRPRPAPSTRPQQSCGRCQKTDVRCQTAPSLTRRSALLAAASGSDLPIIASCNRCASTAPCRCSRIGLFRIPMLQVQPRPRRTTAGPASRSRLASRCQQIR
jgi:hypothetical protein